MMIYSDKSGQIWVETVIYTLIAFVMIGAVLTIAQPKIQEVQDKALIDQSLGVMKDMNNIFLSLAQGGAGNKRLVELGVKKGNFIINGEDNSITFEMDSAYMYSEPGTPLTEGGITIYTLKKGDTYSVNMTQSYQNYNITLNGLDDERIISKASTSYQLLISNKGKDSSNKIIMDIGVQ
jgi:type II secretory pathway pseudopilin PulG